MFLRAIPWSVDNKGPGNNILDHLLYWCLLMLLIYHWCLGFQPICVPTPSIVFSEPVAKLWNGKTMVAVSRYHCCMRLVQSFWQMPSVWGSWELQLNLRELRFSHAYLISSVLFPLAFSAWNIQESSMWQM